VRREDPRLAARIRAALGDARTVVNVGAGAGSYEPSDLELTAVEPSAVMRAQRPPRSAPAVDARAEQLPFDDDSFDAALAVLSNHHWEDHDRGLLEMRRVSVFRLLPPDEVADAMKRLAADLDSGEWERRNAELLDLDELDLGYRLVVTELTT
jgi:SAM-dependent methyltransferase